MSQPVIIDLETRSACGLKSEGPYRYAAHKTTRVLTAAWTEHGSGVMHCWFPGLAAIPADMQALHLPGVVCYYGFNVPDSLASLTNRIWVGHNAYGFDALVWRALYPDVQPLDWADSMCMASACGMPGGLDRIGQWLWGEGKYEAGKKEAKKAFTATSLDDCDAKHVPLLRQVMTGKYNVQDVKITDLLWAKLQEEFRTTTAEAAVFAAHRDINERGLRLDFPFLEELHKLAVESKAESIAEIVRLTNGALPDEKAVQSGPRMLAWLTKMGVWEGKSLRRQLVSQFIDENEEEDSEEEVDDTCKDLSLVVKVLRLRLAALRITGGKVGAAGLRMSDDGYIRNVWGYWKAHTGRWTSTGVQFHNLPKPKPGVDVWKLVDLYERTGKLKYADVRSLLPIGDARFPDLSVDDAASSLIKCMVIPDEGKVFAAADLAQIEARVLAWLAGEKWLLDLFWADGDPYLKLATAIMGPPSTWPDEGVPWTKHSYRQKIGKVIELAAGYGQGAVGNRIYCESVGVDVAKYGTSNKACILAYRRTHPAIAGDEYEYKGTPYFKGGIWTQMNDAAIQALESGRRVSVQGKVSFHVEHGNLHMTLPSGRRLVYRKAKIVETYPFDEHRPVPAVQFEHPRFGDKAKPQYGGKWVENAVQAISRDVLGEGLVRNAAAEHPACLHVHDEQGASIDPNQFDDFMSCVTRPLDWLQDFPLDCEGGCGPRYAKAAYPGWNKGKEVTYRNGKRHK